jgi:hypothetical protein
MSDTPKPDPIFCSRFHVCRPNKLSNNMRLCVLLYVQGIIRYRYTFAVMCRKHHAVRLSSDLFHSMTFGCAQT